MAQYRKHIFLDNIVREQCLFCQEKIRILILHLFKNDAKKSFEKVKKSISTVVDKLPLIKRNKS